MGKRSSAVLNIAMMAVLLTANKSAFVELPATAYTGEQREQQSVLPDGRTPQSARALTKLLIVKEKWNNKKQWQCLQALWYAESRWKYTADNPYTTAYGIAQVLNTPENITPKKQIERGVRYINHRYKTPCVAWQHFKKHDWY